MSLERKMNPAGLAQLRRLPSRAVITGVTTTTPDRGKKQTTILEAQPNHAKLSALDSSESEHNSVVRVMRGIRCESGIARFLHAQLTDKVDVKSHF